MTNDTEEIMTKVIFITVATIFSASTAFAGVNDTPRLDQRQYRQEQRIERGESSGALTSREAARLERGQDRVDTMEANAKADGVVTRSERARLEAASDRQSDRIYRQKHDRQHDYNHNGLVDRPARWR